MLLLTDWTVTRKKPSDGNWKKGESSIVCNHTLHTCPAHLNTHVISHILFWQWKSVATFVIRRRSIVQSNEVSSVFEFPGNVLSLNYLLHFDIHIWTFFWISKRSDIELKKRALHKKVKKCSCPNSKNIHLLSLTFNSQRTLPTPTMGAMSQHKNLLTQPNKFCVCVET